MSGIKSSTKSDLYLAFLFGLTDKDLNDLQTALY